MNRKELVRAVSKKLDYTQKDILEVLDVTFDTIAEVLKSGDEVNYTNFGRFTRKEAKARQRVNPQTKELVDCPAHHVVKFKPSAVLRELVK